MKIPIAKPYFDQEEERHIVEVLRSGWVTQGPKVQEFERLFAEYTGAKHAIAVSSCTTALHLSLYVSGIGPGDEVICPSLSYIATANSIVHCGATPVFAEVGADLNMDIGDVRLKITKQTKAILLVHQIGNPAELDAYKALCEEKGLILIEDAACAIGSEYKGQKIGNGVNLTCFSFHPRKVITTGDGGMICTNDEALASRLRILRQHGMSVTDRKRHQSKKVILEEYLEVGFNYRMTDLQAAVGIEQLKKLTSFVDQRRRIAEVYRSELKDIQAISFIEESDHCQFNYQSFAIFIDENYSLSRNEIMQDLLDRGISTRRGIMLAHEEKAYSDRNLVLPQSEKYSHQCILLPIYHELSLEEARSICKEIRRLFN